MFTERLEVGCKRNTESPSSKQSLHYLVNRWADVILGKLNRIKRFNSEEGVARREQIRTGPDGAAGALKKLNPSITSVTLSVFYSFIIKPQPDNYI